MPNHKVTTSKSIYFTESDSVEEAMIDAAKMELGKLGGFYSHHIDVYLKELIDCWPKQQQLECFVYIEILKLGVHIRYVEST